MKSCCAEDARAADIALVSANARGRFSRRAADIEHGERHVHRDDDRCRVRHRRRASAWFPDDAARVVRGLVIDGFDAQAMGYVAPAVIADWQVSKAALGPFSASLLGMLLGALGLSVLADRIGRRPVLIGATLFFSVSMIATAFTHSLPVLTALRFVTGLGLGCIMPNAMALVGEFSTTQHRVKRMMLVSCGFTLGAALGGFLSAALIPAFGWRSGVLGRWRGATAARPDDDRDVARIASVSRAEGTRGAGARVAREVRSVLEDRRCDAARRP